jgi:hypothetical protein
MRPTSTALLAALVAAVPSAPALASGGGGGNGPCAQVSMNAQGKNKTGAIVIERRVQSCSKVAQKVEYRTTMAGLLGEKGCTYDTFGTLLAGQTVTSKSSCRNVVAFRTYTITFAMFDRSGLLLGQQIVQAGVFPRA